MRDLIDRQQTIDICDNVIDSFRGQFGAGVLVAIKESIEELPPVQPEQWWIPVTKEEVFKAGYEGREIRFRVDGRLFAIRELAQ